MAWRGPEAVSPTAHYTGAVWAAAGLSHPALQTTEGRVLHFALRPAMTASRLAGGPTLQGFLLARHALLDHRLEAAVQEGRIGQVLEIAAGMSPRGWRFTRRHGAAIAYVEADLPAMAGRKRRALARAGGGPEVVALDAFQPGGLDPAEALLDPARGGLAVVTEGLLNYFDRASVEDLWMRIAALIGRCGGGVYLSDLHVRADTPAAGRAFEVALGAFVRGRVHMHYRDAEAARETLLAAGFDRAELHSPKAFPQLPETRDPSAGLVRVVEAAVG